METKEDLIRSLTTRLRRIIDKHLCMEESPIRLAEGVRVTPREIHTIQAIGERKRINITDLGACFGVTKSAASQIVTKLVRKGFVNKERSAHSGKEWELILTELGWQAFHAHEQLHSKHEAAVIQRLSAFSSSQIAITSDLLGVIEGIVEERMSEEGVRKV